MKRFIQQHAQQISGVLNGFDRMRFRGTLRWLAYTNGMQWFLNSTGNWAGKRVRALQPWSPADAQLLEAVSRPEFLLNGFRNKDLRPILNGEKEASPEEQRRQSAKVSRQLRMLRAHGLILKVVHTHRYQLIPRNRTILAALQAARQANPEQLAKLAA